MRRRARVERRDDPAVRAEQLERLVAITEHRASFFAVERVRALVERAGAAGMRLLSERKRTVIAWRLRGLSLAEIGRREGITRQAVHGLERSAIETLEACAREEGR